MRRIVLTCATITVVMLLAAVSATAGGRTAGFLVVQKANSDGGVHGHAIVTLILVRGFVVGRVPQGAEARVDIFHLPSATGEGAPQAFGDVSRRRVRWHGRSGIEFNGSGFHFRAIDGAYRVVVRGARVYLFAGGDGSVTLRGSAVYRRSDGTYSVDGQKPQSMPTVPLIRQIGRG